MINKENLITGITNTVLAVSAVSLGLALRKIDRVSQIKDDPSRKPSLFSVDGKPDGESYGAYYMRRAVICGTAGAITGAVIGCGVKAIVAFKNLKC